MWKNSVGVLVGEIHTLKGIASEYEERKLGNLKSNDLEQKYAEKIKEMGAREDLGIYKGADLVNIDSLMAELPHKIEFF